MMILTISILYYKFLFFSYTLCQSLQSLTLAESRMPGTLGRRGYMHASYLLLHYNHDLHICLHVGENYLFLFKH
jgi:hypothetical protein